MASTKDYYSDNVIKPLTTSFVAQPFGFHAQTLTLKNDETSGSITVSYSVNGASEAGRLKPGESTTIDRLSNGVAVLSLKSSTAGGLYRLSVVGV